MVSREKSAHGHAMTAGIARGSRLGCGPEGLKTGRRPVAERGTHNRFGALVRSRRLAAGLTLRELAGRSGCGASYLSLIENGRKPPPGEAVLEKLERALGLAGGQLVEAARLERAPEALREDVLRAREQRRATERLLELVRRGGIDEAYRSGKLAAAIGSIEGSLGVDAPEPTAPPELPMEVPLINRVSAGYPAGFTDLGFPARVADEYVRAPDVHDPDAFAARVVGDSMEPDYREGDVVVFSPQRPLENGCDCFARLEPDDESTFKRVYFEEGEAGAALIRLQPINNRYPPRVLPRERVAGLYRAVTVMRRV